MSRWRILLPVARSTDSLGQVGANCRQIADAEDRAVARENVLIAGQAGARNAADLKALMESLSPQERRAALDTIRSRLGLKSIHEIKAAEEVQQASLAARSSRHGHVDVVSGGATGFVDSPAAIQRQASKDAAATRTRDAQHQVRLEEAALDSERHRAREWTFDNMPAQQ